MSTKTTVRLSLFGVILTIAGFYVSNASSFPLVQQILAPSYVRAKAAVERLQRDGSSSAGYQNFVHWPRSWKPSLQRKTN